MSTARKVTFKGEEFLLIGETDGPIATLEQYVNADASFAYLRDNGDIMRFRQKIGTLEDLTFGEDVKLPPTSYGDIMKLLKGLLDL